MSPFIVFFIGMAVFLLLAFVGIPIAFSFAIVGFVGTIFVMGLGPGLSLLGSAPMQWGGNADLLAVPLFVLMGQFAFHSAISRDLFEAAYKWIGRLPGGLALATNVACTGFAACCGSAMASGATMGTLAYPEMKRFNYHDRLATGCIAGGGTLGILIPPSIPLIVYGFITHTDIGKLFIAGIFPGLMLSGMFLGVILVMCIRNPKLGPSSQAFPWRERLSSLTGIWGMLALFLLVIGGLYGGVFAPSEAGAVGAFGAFIIAMSRRTKIPMFGTALKDSLRLTVMIMTIIIGAMIFGVFVTVSGFTTAFTNWVVALPVPPLAIVVAILIIYIPLGMLIEAIPMTLLTLPIVFPIVQDLGFSLVWFGILVVLMSQIAHISPPVGLVAYIVQGVTKVPLHEVFRGILPFIYVLLLCVAILVAFPQISLFLPAAMAR